jgi:hypothetical protein
MEMPQMPASSGAGSHPGSLQPMDLKSSARDAAAQLRERLLKMIVSHEQARHSATADSLKPR